MLRRLFLLSLVILSVAAAGCQSTAPEPESNETGDLNPSAAIMAAYHPRVVKLIEVFVNSTVTEPFADDLHSQRYRIDNWVQFNHVPIAQWMEANRTPPYDLDHKTIMSRDLTHLWRIQDNDTLVLGQAHLVSNKHDIFDQTLAVAEQYDGIRIHVGGMDFHFGVASEGLVTAFYGPYTPGSVSDELPFREFPYPIRNSIRHESRFPMLGQDQFTITYPVAPVLTNITIRYWGNVRFLIPEDHLEPYRNDLSLLDSVRIDHVIDFQPGGRLGQVALTCSQTPLKAYDPCMDRWEHPLT